MKIEYEDLRYRIEEDAGYALKYYFGRDLDHKDEELVRLWHEAHDKLLELEKYINKKAKEIQSG